MKLINQLLENICKYGNSKLYFECKNKRANRVINFKIDKTGNISIYYTFEIFDRPFWNGVKKDENAELIEKIDDYHGNRNLLNLCLATILCYSLHENNILLTCKEIKRDIDLSRPLNEIYAVVSKMLNLTNAEIAQIVLTDEFAAKNIFLDKVPKKEQIEIEQIGSEEIIDSINEKFEDVYERFNYIYSLYENVLNSEKQDNDLITEWERICQDTTINNPKALKK